MSKLDSTEEELSHINRIQRGNKMLVDFKLFIMLCHFFNDPNASMSLTINSFLIKSMRECNSKGEIRNPFNTPHDCGLKYTLDIYGMNNFTSHVTVKYKTKE